MYNTTNLLCDMVELHVSPTGQVQWDETFDELATSIFSRTI